MTDQDINKQRNNFDRLLSLGRVHDAIVLLRGLSESKMRWEITDEIDKIDSSYSYLLQYAVDGVDDPHRREIYENLVASLSQCFDRLDRELRLPSDPAAYFNAARQTGGLTPTAAIDAYLRTLRTANEFDRILSENGTARTDLQGETKASVMFDAVWTAFPLTSEGEASISALLASDEAPAYAKQLVISAVMMGQLAYFDERRLSILAEYYRTNRGSSLSAIALTALLLSLFIGRRRRLSAKTAAHIEMLKDVPGWQSDIRTVFLELIRTRDTERITRKMTDEIVPEMLRMKPEIDKKMAGIKIEELDAADLEENPEWQDMLEKSGIADRLKELTEIQEEGGDVMMGTFAHLKSFPFFFSVANWFLPFHSDHSIVKRIGEGSDIIAELIEQSPFMCDSDKYSFVLAIGSVPQAQRDMMTSQLRAQNINAAELMNASLVNENDARRNIVNKYVQNLYRFFRLFRRKEDFSDPFAQNINLTEVDLLTDEFSQGETLDLVAEFYFKHQYYREALDVFSVIDAKAFPDAQRYQKMGYCEQNLGNIDSALQYYEQSELLDAANLWTLKRIAHCSRTLRQFDKALRYYIQVDIAEPGSVATQLNIAHCQMELGQYDDAVKTLYKADYISESKPKVVRRLAWALMMTRDYDAASQRYGVLLAGPDAEAADFLNAGHLEMPRANYRAAIGLYTEFVKRSDNRYTNFINAMRADTPALLSLGVKEDMIPLIIDAVAYKCISNK